MPTARFVHIVDEVPELAQKLTQGSAGPVMVVALEGFLDAGNATALAVAHLSAGEAGRVVASFEVDEFYDYRARRPGLTFVENHYADYEAPRLVVRLLDDEHGSPYLLLAGPEPDIRWEAFALAVRQVIEQFGVRLVVALGSVPMAVPHTRPIQLTNHATDDRLLVQDNLWRGNIRVPSSAQALLEVRLGEWGHDAMGFVAHIPHYLAQLDYPGASYTLLESVGDATGLTFDLEALRTAAEAKQAEIAGQISESAEVAEVVAGLEQQYDAFHSAQDNLLAGEGGLPSGEQIGAEFERFLAGLDDRGDD